MEINQILSFLERFCNEVADLISSNKSNFEIFQKDTPLPANIILISFFITKLNPYFGKNPYVLDFPEFYTATTFSENGMDGICLGSDEYIFSDHIIEKYSIYIVMHLLEKIRLKNYSFLIPEYREHLPCFINQKVPIRLLI